MLESTKGYISRSIVGKSNNGNGFYTCHWRHGKYTLDTFHKAYRMPCTQWNSKHSTKNESGHRLRPTLQYACDQPKKARDLGYGILRY